MRLWNAIAARLLALMGRAPDRDLDDELRFHVEMEAQALERDGRSRGDAQREARRRFGGLDRYAEEVRDIRGHRWIEWMEQDMRYALRVARRFPAFTAIVVTTLAVAIGANAAVFSVIDTVMLAPLPFPRGHELAFLYAQNPDRSFPRFSVSYADFLDWRADTRSFAGMAAYTRSTLTITEGDEPERLAGLLVTRDFFDVLGARPAHGRLFRAGDPDAEAAGAVLTHGFWTRRFGGDTTIVGRVIRMGGGPLTVIGILPANFDLDGSPTDVVTVLDPAMLPNVENHAQHLVQVVGRLRPGVTLAAAQQDLGAVAGRLAQIHPSIAGWSANVFLMRDELVRTVRRPLLILLAGAGLVMLIACTNVASLLLTRNAMRSREVALRRALGASRLRLVSQMLVECAALAALGVSLGIGVAYGILKIIGRVAPDGLLPADAGLPLNWRMLSFVLGLVALTTVLAGLWPALRSTATGLARTLREGGRGASDGLRALQARRLLVVAEVSLALVLVICAGLVLQSLDRLLRVDPGFSVENVVTARVSLPGRYRDSMQVRFFRDLQGRLNARPEIENAAAANTAPIADGGIVTNVVILGRANAGNAANEKTMAAATAITPGYFRTTGMSLLQGEDVQWTGAQLVVSEAAARRFWPGESAIGKRIGFGSDTVGMPVVGIVSDAHNRGLAQDPLPMLYMGYQSATGVVRTMTLVVRGRAGGSAESVVATMKQALREVDPALPLYGVQTVRALLDQSVAQPRLNTTMLTIFALVGVVLAVLGIYGVVSYSVTQRAQELGVRMALGAQRGDVIRLVLREGVGLAAIGAAIGVLGALAGTTAIRGWLFGIGRTDPATIVSAAVGLVVVAIVASYVPAMRAARVDPVTAMRAE